MRIASSPSAAGKVWILKRLGGREFAATEVIKRQTDPRGLALFKNKQPRLGVIDLIGFSKRQNSVLGRSRAKDIADFFVVDPSPFAVRHFSDF